MVVPSLNSPNGSGLCNKPIQIRSQTRVLLYTVAGEIKYDTDTTERAGQAARDVVVGGGGRRSGLGRTTPYSPPQGLYSLKHFPTLTRKVAVSDRGELPKGLASTRQAAILNLNSVA